MKSDGKGRFAARIFTVAALTLAAAYYVPLYRTHTQLLADYHSLAARVTTSEQAAASAQAALAAETAKAGAASAAHEDDEAAKGKRDARLGQAEQACRALASERDVTVARRGERVVITLSGAALRPSHDHVDVIPLSALCDATAKVAAPLNITVVAGVGGAKGRHDPWELAADRAARVAHLLEQSCKVPASRLSATARVSKDSDSIDIEID